MIFHISILLISISGGGGLNLISDPRPFLVKIKIRLPVQIRFDAVKNRSFLLLQNTAANYVAAVLEREKQD